MRWVLKTVRSLPRLTHLICHGDLFEAEAASVHPNERATDLLDEYKTAADLLAKLRQVVPKSCKLIWLLGNHDDNLQAADPRRIPKRLRGIVHWNRSDHREEFLKWRQIPYVKDRTGTCRIGQVIWAHGWDCGVNSDEHEAIQLINLHGGFSHGLVIRGHTHRPVPLRQVQLTKRVPLPAWCMNVGTLGDLKPPYMSRKDTGCWGPGLAYVETTGRLNPRAREWHAELLRP